MASSRAALEGEQQVSLLGIGCSEQLPAYKQAELATLYAAYVDRMVGDRRLGRRASLLFSRAGIETRRLSLGLGSEASGAISPLYAGGAIPTTAERMQAYRRVAPQLALEAAHAALEQADVPREGIGSLVVATCTGIGEPALDLGLASALTLPRDVEHSQLVWMSCSAAFPALRIAARSALSRRRPALLVCVEMCSLHVRCDDDPGSLLAHALFADGAAALVVGPPSDDACLAALWPVRGRRIENTGGALTWQLTDHGFRAHIAPELPALIERECARFVAEIDGLGGLGGLEGTDGVDAWCVHPGGPAILSAVERALGLPEAALVAAREVLRTRGNMSSPTILYVLRDQLRDMAPGERGCMLGFGTGVSIEALPFVRGDRPLEA